MPRKKDPSDRSKPPIGGVKKSVKNSHTSPRAIELQMKRGEALDYRIQGYTFEQIGQAMEVDTSTAFRWVDEAMKAITREPAEHVKSMEKQRLDAMLTGCYPNAVEGDAAAINSVLRIMERRARLEGFDAPVKTSLTDPTGNEVQSIQVSFVKPEVEKRVNGHANGHAVNGNGAVHVEADD